MRTVRGSGDRVVEKGVACQVGCRRIGRVFLHNVVRLAFIAASPYWMRNIHNRFMRVRYTNMESFRATR